MIRPLLGFRLHRIQFCNLCNVNPTFHLTSLRTSLHHRHSLVQTDPLRTRDFQRRPQHFNFFRHCVLLHASQLCLGQISRRALLRRPSRISDSDYFGICARCVHSCGSHAAGGESSRDCGNERSCRRHVLARRFVSISTKTKRVQNIR